jgi:hypothetical protein
LSSQNNIHMRNNNIIIVGRHSVFLKLLYNQLLLKNSDLNIKVVCEKSESYLLFLIRRVKKIGIFTVIGQLFFVLLIVLPQTLLSRKRINSIFESNGVIHSKIPEENIIHIDSINSDKFLDIISHFKCSYVILCGSRIVLKRTLESAKCRFLNIHAGITPLYRGVHGLYWALYNREIDKAGVTLHYVDSGIDTGNIISQEIVSISKADNFSTYPYLQFFKGLNLLSDFLNYPQNKKDNLSEKEILGKLYYHPTIYQYLVKYFKHNLK